VLRYNHARVNPKLAPQHGHHGVEKRPGRVAQSSGRPTRSDLRRWGGGRRPGSTSCRYSTRIERCFATASALTARRSWHATARSRRLSRTRSRADHRVLHAILCAADPCGVQVRMKCAPTRAGVYPDRCALRVSMSRSQSGSRRSVPALQSAQYGTQQSPAAFRLTASTFIRTATVVGRTAFPDWRGAASRAGLRHRNVRMERGTHAAA